MICRHIKLAVCVVFLIITICSACFAFSTSHEYRRIDRMAAGAEYIVVGKVKSISDGEKFVVEGSGWKQPLIRKHAVLDVYRIYQSRQDIPVLKEDELSISYMSVDYSEKYTVRFGIPDFPYFIKVNIGDVFAFPVYRTDDDPGKLVVLNDMNHIFLIPCVKEQIPDAKIDTTLDFLYSEIAGTVAYGSYEEVYNVINLFSYILPTSNIPDSVLSMIKRNVKDNNRWFDIFVISYCSLHDPKPRITELDDSNWSEYMKSKPEFMYYALEKASPENLEEQFISSIIRHVDFQNIESELIINSQYNETMNRILSDVLNSNEFTSKTLSLITNIINNKDLQFTDSTIRASVEASKRFLANTPNAEDYEVSTASRLIVIYGNDDDFSVITDEIRKAAGSDKKRFDTLWSIATGVNPSKKKTISVCRVLINNKNDYTANLMYRDLAVKTLQQVTGEDFGFDETMMKFLRYKAVSKAKEWLAKNPL